TSLSQADTRIYPIYDLLAKRHARPPTTQTAPNGSAPYSDDPIEQLVRIITETVAPELWRDNGGAVGSIRTWDGLLIITQSPKNHEAIERLLAEMRSGLGAPW